jgi:hypothetical protein
VWQSAELKLPLLVEISDPLSGEITMRYRNIQSDGVDPSLFELPEGFQVTNGSLSAPAKGVFGQP